MAVIILTGTTACQSTPEKALIESADVEKISVSTQDIGQQYSWGGEILEIDNFRNTTELTVRGYPLDKDARPDVDEPSTGRFIAVYTGFLEPTDYHKGRLISLSGALIEIRHGNIESADYDFPVISIDEIKLLGRKQDEIHVPFTIGIGIGIHN